MPSYRDDGDDNICVIDVDESQNADNDDDDDEVIEVHSQDASLNI